MSRLTAVTPDYSPAQPLPRDSRGEVAVEKSPDAVVLAFPRLLASQADLVDAIRDLIETAYAITRSEAVARALVEVHSLLDALEVD